MVDEIDYGQCIFHIKFSFGGKKRLYQSIIFFLEYQSRITIQERI